MKVKRVVVTGAATGPGRATAELLARKGVRVLLLDLPDEAEALASLTGALSSAGLDVSSASVKPGEAMPFEGEDIDGWVNAVSRALEADALEGSLGDARRIFDACLWTAVRGSESAVARMRERGGVLVNVGSIHSDRAFPGRSAQGAAEHAIKAYTDALRMELAMQRVPVKVSLVKAALPRRHGPEVTARAILRCLERPRRHITVGAATALLSALERFVPSVLDRLLLRTGARAPRAWALRAGGQADVA